jgi:hypothetical protein
MSGAVQGRWRHVTSVMIGGLAAVLLCAASASAQDRVGAHFGAVFPLVTHVNGDTVNIGDDFKIGFPMGITIKTSGTVAFDLELVPALDPVKNGPTNVTLTVHPGILKGLGNGWTLGGRMAFDINGNSWGFTPLINKGFPHGAVTYFIEGVLPIRFQDDPLVNETHTAVTVGVHVGVAF